jgi:hypothetical protein
VCGFASSLWMDLYVAKDCERLKGESSVNLLSEYLATSKFADLIRS